MSFIHKNLNFMWKAKLLKCQFHYTGKNYAWCASNKCDSFDLHGGQKIFSALFSTAVSTPTSPTSTTITTSMGFSGSKSWNAPTSLLP